MGRATAPHWSGPYTVDPEPIFANQNEDPYIYRDSRGHFHAIFHGMDPWLTGAWGAHAFSLDAKDWVYSRAEAFSRTVQFEDNSTVQYTRRERPEFIFDQTTGEITNLVSGVWVTRATRLCSQWPPPERAAYTRQPAVCGLPRGLRSVVCPLDGGGHRSLAFIFQFHSSSI